MNALCWLACIAAVILMAGCVPFQPQALSPSQTADAFQSRSLTDSGLLGFLSSNGVPSEESIQVWDLRALTLVAFYCNPDLALVRAQ